MWCVKNSKSFMKNSRNLTDFENEIKTPIEELIAFLEKNDFQGWEPYDIPEFRLKNFRLPPPARVMVTQLFRLSPIFVHPRFKEKRLHTKAAALFAHAFLLLFEQTKAVRYREKAIFFLHWLQEHRSPQSRHFSIGTQYQLSMKNYGSQPGTPAPLLTCLAIEAFLTGYEILGDTSYLKLAESGIRYFCEELPQVKLSDNLSYFIYHPNHKQFIPNLPAVVCGTLARFHSISKENKLLEVIRSNLNYVIQAQQKDGSWRYHPRASYADSFHTAFILESLAKYQYYLGDNFYEPYFKKGWSYYAQTFFKADMRPVHKKRYGIPGNTDALLTKIDLRDIAMGLVLYSSLTIFQQLSPDPALNLLRWSLKNFRSSRGYFYYQQTSLYLIKGPFLSLQAWMLYALGKLWQAMKSIES